MLAPLHCLGCDEQPAEAFCDACRTLVERTEEAHAVFAYGGPIADAIHRLKYGGRSDLADRLGGLMACAAERWRGEVDAVVPVPLHWRRRRARGFDQAALLARPIATALDVPVRLRALRRVRNTPSQVDLPHAARRRNVAGAFEVARGVSGVRVLLVDDVRTTGATLESAGAALRGGQVADVRNLVLATRVLAPPT